MRLHNPTLKDLNAAVNANREAEKRAKNQLIIKINELKEKKYNENEILTYIIKNSGLDLYNAKRFLKYN